jgi:hypothetical protein
LIKKINRSSSVSKSTVLTKYLSLIKDNSNNDAKYRFVNLESSCNSSVSRTKSPSGHSFMSSSPNTFKIADRIRNSKAQELSESLKRSKSAKRISQERSITDPPSTIKQLKRKIYINRVNSDRS